MSDLSERVWSAIDNHRPLPTEVISLDLGEFGDVLATVEYEVNPADTDGSGERIPASLSIYSVTVDRLGDVLPFIQSLHRDALVEVEERVAEKLRGNAE